MNKLLLIFLILIGMFVVYWIYSEIFFSDIVATIMFFAMFVVVIIIYKTMLRS